MRLLTGNWYLKRRFFGFIVMVECIRTSTCPYTLSTSPEFICWEKAKDEDLIILNIKVI